VGSRGLLLLPALLILSCGGGGGATSAVTLSGRLTIPAALVASSLRAAEPDDRAATARLLRDAPEGTLDAVADPVDAFRVVASTAGLYRADLEATGFLGEAMLHDLGSGEVATELRVEEGDVFDVVVHAREGAGAYRVLLREGQGEVAPRTLPASYCECGEGFVPCEIVASPAAGLDAHRLAAEAGLDCCAAGPRACLLRDGTARADQDFRGLCDLLARCARLEAEGLVRWAEPNQLRRLAGLPDDPYFPEQWALAQVRAPAAWDLATTTDAIVAIVDSGVRAHPDLVDNLVSGWDFEANDDDPTDPTPGFSHGTQVVGIIGATGDNATGVAGVLWSAKLMPLRAFDTSGYGTSFDIANAILFAAGLDNESGTLPAEPASVVNLSFASTISTLVEEDACDRARAAGLFLCAASGNQGSTAVRYPAGYAAVVGVGATDSAARRAAYSNYGSWVDLVAPGGTRGAGVVTTAVLGSDQFGYLAVDGTSFASPHVAAVAALCRGLVPLTPAETEQVLLDSAQDIGAAGPDVQTGYGIVDAYRAALLALQQPPPPLYPYEEIEVRLLTEFTGTVVTSIRTDAAQGLAWTLPAVPAGRYILEAGTDRNHDGILSGPGELYGRWHDGEGADTLFASEPRSDLDFPLTVQE